MIAGIAYCFSSLGILSVPSSVGTLAFMPQNYTNPANIFLEKIIILHSVKILKPMITFIVCLAALITGYFTYGKFVEKFFGASSSRPTPAKRLADGVD